MQFINPYELLEVENPDASVVKKAKKRKLAEIRLSDDATIEYESKIITESLFNNIIGQLDDVSASNFYQQLMQDKDLSSFLKFGELDFFERGN